jgi:putative membrane protein
MTLLIKWLLSALSIFLVGTYLPGIHVPDYKAALLVALVLAVLNVTLRPVLKLVSLPITILTLGLFAFVVNGFVFWLVGKLVASFVIDSFWWAIIGSIVVTIVTSLLELLVLGPDGKWGKSKDA